MGFAQTTKPFRVFVDSSVLYAASLSARGPASELVLRGIRGEVELMLSPLVLDETRRNLTDKAPQALTAFDIFRDVIGARPGVPQQGSGAPGGRGCEPQRCAYRGSGTQRTRRLPRYARCENSAPLQRRDQGALRTDPHAATRSSCIAARESRLRAQKATGSAVRPDLPESLTAPCGRSRGRERAGPFSRGWG